MFFLPPLAPQYGARRVLNLPLPLTPAKCVCLKRGETQEIRPVKTDEKEKEDVEVGGCRQKEEAIETKVFFRSFSICACLMVSQVSGFKPSPIRRFNDLLPVDESVTFDNPAAGAQE